MEQFPLIGNYIHVYRGEKRCAEAVRAALYHGIFAEEAAKQASMPGTAMVLCGDVSKKVAGQGVTRKVTITGTDILDWTERSYREWNGSSHWDVVAVVSYYGGVQVYPEGAQSIDAAPAGISLEEFKFRGSLKTAGPIVWVEVEAEG